ncbi:unnamed protein product [marine sediment metagenome]|uniref:DUF4386 domain-containing protein n=1 Tax=marine sediment metagenome TaxID=412755 RepID=X0ZNR2_9ZZZZ
MGSNRKTAIAVGVLFIVGTVAGSLSVVLSASILGAPDYLAEIAANENRVVVGALLELIMAAAVVAIPFVMFPIFKKHNEPIALGYVGARIIEGVGYIVAVIILLSLTTLSQAFVKAGAPDASYFQASGALLLAEREWATLVGVYIVFNLGALMFYYLLYQSKLIPRFISAWGFIAALLWLAGVLLILFGLTDDSSTTYTLSFVPMFAQEMVLAVWLIVKGFNPSAIDPGSTKTDTNKV